MAPRGHTLLLKKTLQERLRLCKELVDTLEKLWRAELASRAAHQVGLWSGVLNTGYSGVQAVNSRVKERLPASGLLEERARNRAGSSLHLEKRKQITEQLQPGSAQFLLGSFSVEFKATKNRCWWVGTSWTAHRTPGRCSDMDNYMRKHTCGCAVS